MSKKFIFGLTAVATAVVAIVACTRGFEKFDARKTNAGLLADCDPVSCEENYCEIEREGVATLPCVITGNLTLDRTKTWIMEGRVYVDDGARLTILAGTLIKANNATAALFVTRGGRIYAEGTVDCPIVFTSNRPDPGPGDWGGIVLLGRAPLNRPDTSVERMLPLGVPPGIDINYGGGIIGLGNCDDTSGALQYVRIEYAGARIDEDTKFSALTCAGVGRGTKLSYIQVYRSDEDAFEFFSGTVNADHLYAYVPDDDAFDFDYGYKGCIQFAVSVLNNTDDYSFSPNGIVSDDDPIGNPNAPRTRAKISNMTVVGLCDSIDARKAGDVLWQGAYFFNTSDCSVYNSIFMGFVTGVLFDGTGVIDDTSFFRYNLVHGFETIYRGPSPPFSFISTNNGYRTAHANDSIKLVAPCNYDCPDFRPQTTSPAVSGANFDTGCIVDCCKTSCDNNVNFFQTVPYRGAFAPCNAIGSNWLAGWTKHPPAP